MTELEAYKLVIAACDYGLNLNMNDTFYYACADNEELNNGDVEHLIPLIQKYKNHALDAYAAVKRGHDPSIKAVLTSEFYAAKKEIKKLAEDGTILFEEWYETQKIMEDMNDFGGQTTQWTSFTTRFAKILNKDPKYVTVMRIVRLEDGLLAVGRSYSDTRTRLKKKYENRKKRLANVQ